MPLAPAAARGREREDEPEPGERPTGAHAYVDDITPEDAADAVEFTKAFILYLFVFDAAFHEHMDRRPAKV